MRISRQQHRLPHGHNRPNERRNHGRFLRPRHPEDQRVIAATWFCVLAAVLGNATQHIHRRLLVLKRWFPEIHGGFTPFRIPVSIEQSRGIVADTTHAGVFVLVDPEQAISAPGTCVVPAGTWQAFPRSARGLCPRRFVAV